MRKLASYISFYLNWVVFWVLQLFRNRKLSGSNVLNFNNKSKRVKKNIDQFGKRYYTNKTRDN